MKSSDVSCHEASGDFMTSNKVERWCGVHPSVLLKTPKACEARIGKTNAIRARFKLAGSQVEAWLCFYYLIGCAATTSRSRPNCIGNDFVDVGEHHGVKHSLQQQCPMSSS